MEEKLINLLPAYVRWAMKTPENYVIFWWIVMVAIVILGLAISWTEEKKERRTK